MSKLTDKNLLILIALLSIVSLPLAWWHMTMHAPQYPDGLQVNVGLFGVSGDVAEVDDLNHYIGFRPLGSIAPIERRLAWLAIPAALLPLFGAFALRKKRYAWLTALPAAIIPVFFAGDLIVWMWYAGNHLDPHAALSSAVKPWTPNFLGPGGVGQFHTFGMFDIGFLFAALALIGTVVLAARAAHPSSISTAAAHGRGAHAA